MGRSVVGVGAMYLIGALGAYLYATSFVRSARVTNARVVALKADHRNSKIFHTVFKFRDNQDKEHVIMSDMASSSPEYHVGDSIVVLYTPTSPTNARIQNFFSVWGLTFALALMGSIAVSVGILLLNWPGIEAKLSRRPPIIDVV